MKSSTSFLRVVILVASLAILAGCGGTGGNGGGNFNPPPPPPPTLNSVSVNPANPSVTAGGTQQFTAKGTYSDNSTKDLTSSVTWTSSTTATATIASSGMAQAVAAGTSTITATSGSVKGSTVLTVTASQPPPPQAPTVTSISPAILWLDSEAIEGTIATGTNFTSTTTACTGSTLEILGQTPGNATTMSVSVGFDTPHFTANVYDIGANNGSGCSAQRGKFFFAGNQNTVAVAKSGEAYYRDPGAGLIYKYKVAGDSMTADGTPFTVDQSTGTIAFDDDANAFLITKNGGLSLGAYTPDGTLISSIPSGPSMAGLASAHGNACFAQPTEGKFTGFTISSGATVSQSTGSASQPWAVTTVDLDSGSLCAGYTRGDTKLYLYSLVTMALQGNGMVVQIPANPQTNTPAQTLTAGGNPALISFNGNGTAKGTVALLNPADNKLASIDVSSGTPVVRWIKTLSSSSTSAPVRILADDVGARVIVTYANPQDTNGNVTQASAVDVATGTVSPLAAVSAVAPGAVAISPDDSQLLVFAGTQSVIVPNN